MPIATLILALLQQGAAPEQRAVDYLAVEVARWPAENDCFSCHNNGDAARALYLAHRLSYALPAGALAETTDWLRRPGSWDDGRSDEFGGHKLALIQFSSALVDAFDAGFVADRAPIAEAAAALLEYQDADGAWRVEPLTGPAPPTAYGPVLATTMARRTLERAADARLSEAIERADDWLRDADTALTANAAAVVLALADREDAASRAKIEDALQTLVGAQGTDGGWGPYSGMRTQPFDTAMALLALNTIRDRPGIEQTIQQGRSFLISMQFRGGGWEDDMPAGAGTYARHISTSGWSTLALLATANGH